MIGKKKKKSKKDNMVEKKGEGTSISTREQGNVTLQCIWSLETIESTKEVDENKVHTTKAMIYQTIQEDILMQVAQHSDAKEVWDSIKVRYLGADMVQKARLQTLRSELEVLKMKQNESVSDFARKLGGIRTKFKSLGTTFKDKIIVRKLLNSVPKKFLPIVASIERYSEIDKMPFEEAVGRLTTFEERLKSHDEPEENDQSKLLMASSANNSASWQLEKETTNQNNGKGRQEIGKSESGRDKSFVAAAKKSESLKADFFKSLLSVVGISDSKKKQKAKGL
ncbi:hypothetical protein E3N88_27894 [Mikania micrantha]|uniref:Zinc finger, CCHC-type n=1 Tax=Mikania micrantha TaxID=192012 RepID=A0A5N6MXY8_9ASTR|nr:hypothetical protein E3N88_27894 [Mikania micrantha]